MTDLVETATDAYIWGYPLVVMHRTRALLCSRTPPGEFHHRDELATAADKAVVAPNNDTLYSTAWFDLRAGDLVIDVPPLDHPERYWSVMLLDAYTHVAYVSRRTHGVDGARVRVTLDPSTEPRRDDSDLLTMPTPTVWALVRVLVEGSDDFDAARKAQRSIAIGAPDGHPNDLAERLGPPNRVHEAGARFFDELRAALAVDPPGAWHPQPSAGVAGLLADRSVPDAVLVDAVAAGERRMTERGIGNDLSGNGWGTRFNGSDFGDDTLARATTAKWALAGHHPAENRSYVALHDSDGAPLAGERSVALHFAAGETPPCDGFWSVTLYQPDMFFYDNRINRYAIGDRTGGLQRDADGGVTIIVGNEAPADASNWLPAPIGPYRLGLRVYEGSPEVVAGTWFPPALKPIGN